MDNAKEISPDLRKKIENSQKQELTQHVVYKKLAEKTWSQANASILKEIAEEEKEHYQIFKKYSKKEKNQAN